MPVFEQNRQTARLTHIYTPRLVGYALMGWHLRRFMMKRLALILVALVLATNASQAKTPDIIEISPDTYMITRDSKAGMFASMAKLKTKVIKQANEFAASKNKVIIPISERTARPVPGWPTYEYQFKLVNPDSSEAIGTALESSPGKIVENRNVYSGGVTIKQETDEEPDLYTELMKLDDLRKKGIFTDEEFETQKKKLLEED